MTTKPELYLAIAFIMGGSSWATDTKLESAVKKCAKLVSWDWGSIYKIDNKPLNINVFDITGCEGWYATGRGVFVEGTDEEVPRLKLVETTVPPYKRGR